MVAGYFQAPSLGEPLIPMLMGANTGYHQELQAILVSTKISLGPITSLFSPSPSGSRDRTQTVRLDNILLVLELIQGRDKLRTKSLVVFQRKDKTRMSNCAWSLSYEVGLSLPQEVPLGISRREREESREQGQPLPRHVQTTNIL